MAEVFGVDLMFTFACQIANAAGGFLQHVFAQEEELRESSTHTHDDQYASKFDAQVNELLVRRIVECYPTHSILSEEEDFRQGTTPFTWILDPIDGTTQFVRRLPYYSVSIALAFENKIRFGIVNIPSEQKTVVGGCGIPAGYYSHNMLRPMSVSNVSVLNDSLVACSTFGSFARLDCPELFEILNRKLSRVRVFGSPSLDLCYVAEGKLDARVIAAPKVWDYAAGMAAVIAAGGQVTDWEGCPATMTSRTILASNGKLHSQLLDILSDHST